MTMRERIAEGKLFTDCCEGLPQDRVKARKLMKLLNDSDPENMQERISLIKSIFGEDCGAYIEPPVYFCYGYNITMGRDVYINFNCCFLDDGKIVIGDKAMLGAGVTIATVGHPVNPDMREYMYTAPVTIGKNCWIGASVTICPGVTIGENTVIGAGSVVTGDIPANTVAAGDPCRVMRQISDRDREYYFRDRKIDPADLEEERKLR